MCEYLRCDDNVARARVRAFMKQFRFTRERLFIVWMKNRMIAPPLVAPSLENAFTIIGNQL